MRVGDDVWGEARTLIASRLGLDFPPSRQAHLERGLVLAARASPVPAPRSYLTWLATLPDESPEWRRLAGQLTVGETYFFRDHAVFETLEQQILPALIEARRTAGVARLRLWSAGCATGEEPYSLAILLDRALPEWPGWALTILATDINAAALEKAQRACYGAWSFRDTPAWVRDRYFHRRGGESFELDARIRRMVTFAPLNLAEDGYPSVVCDTSAMDVIFCRNVLMYFTRDAQRETAARLRSALVAGGWLAVSPCEASAELFSPLVRVDFPGAMLYRGEPAPVAPGLTSWPTELVPPGPPPLLVAPSADLETRRSPLPPPSEAEASRRADLERARSLADQGKLDEARELCEVAVARDRLDPSAHLLLAAICQELGEIPDEAPWRPSMVWIPAPREAGGRSGPR